MSFIQIPFFRILIPFCIGILAGIGFEINTIPFFLFIIFFITLTLIHFYSAGKSHYKFVFLFFADVFFVVVGMYSVQTNNIQNHKRFYGKAIQSDSVYTFLATIDELPELKKSRLKCELKLIGLLKNKKFEAVKGHVLTYIKYDSTLLNLKPGQAFLISAKFQTPLAPKNPEEFNYKVYLKHKQIYHLVYTDTRHFRLIDSIQSYIHPFWKFGLLCKSYILSSLKNSALTPQAFSICAALLTGYDEEIEQPVMDAFSHSGTLHVLSVSGLHTGLIYLMLSYLLDFFDKKRKRKNLRFVLTTTVLWLFALITGFSAPVLRAVIMFNLLGAGRIYFRNQLKNQINILCVSAFILLFYNPFFILNVGFQLSYCALFGILFFQPKFQTLLQTDNKLINSVWISISASFAATLATLPLTLLYFKQLPLWFFVCNIVVVPATFVLLIGALLMLLRFKIIALILNLLVKVLISFIMMFNAKGFSYLDGIHFTLIDSIFLTCFLIVLTHAIQLRAFRSLSLALALLLVWQIISIMQCYQIKSKSCLTVYQLSNNSCILVKNKNVVTYHMQKDNGFNYSVKPLLTSFNYPFILKQNFNCIKSDKELFIILSKSNQIPIINIDTPVTIILTNNFQLSEEKLKRYQTLKTIISDGSNNSFTRYKTEKLSRKFGINFYDTKQSGAWLGLLP